MNQKFIIYNLKEVRKYLSNDQITFLNDINHTIANGRYKDGKHPYNQYIVINEDEPYANQVKDIMTEHGHWDN